MSDLGAFLAMGGYAAFVWPAYGLAFLALAGLAAQSWRRYRQSAVALDRLQQGRTTRR
jgi:heme exporter protein D